MALNFVPIAPVRIFSVACTRVCASSSEVEAASSTCSTRVTSPMLNRNWPCSVIRSVQSIRSDTGESDRRKKAEQPEAVMVAAVVAVVVAEG